MKKLLVEPLLLSKTRDGEPLHVYLSVIEKAISSILVKEDQKQQKPIYYISNALQGAEVRDQKIEKLTFAQVVSDWKLRPYFQSHHTVVMTKHLIREMLRKPNLAGRMIAKFVKLSEFSLEYKP